MGIQTILSSGLKMFGRDKIPPLKKPCIELAKEEPMFETSSSICCCNVGGNISRIPSAHSRSTPMPDETNCGALASNEEKVPMNISNISHMTSPTRVNINKINRTISIICLASRNLSCCGSFPSAHLSIGNIK